MDPQAADLAQTAGVPQPSIALSRAEGHASGQGRVFQTTGDQHITEHHHHYTTDWTVAQGRPAVPPPQWLAPDSVRVALVGRTPYILRDRTELMRRLRAAVDGGGGEIHVLHGLGGCGKTAVAHTLFGEVTRDQSRVGLWINASERMSLRTGMLAVAADRGASSSELAAAHAGRRAAADLVWHYLDCSAQPWLLVIDNADDPRMLQEGAWLRTSPRGTVIVTTRRASFRLWQATGAERHRVGVLPTEDAAQMLCDLAPDAGTPADAKRVAERLGCLPLALTLAGSYLTHQLLGPWTMDEYRRSLDNDLTGLIDKGAELDYSGEESRHLVSRTWQLSLDALDERGVPEATTLLRLLACWSSDPVPVSLLAPAAVEETGLMDGKRVELALRGLLDHSLLGLIDVPVSDRPLRCVQAHGVLLDSVAEDVTPELVHTAAQLLEVALPADTAPAGAGKLLSLLTPHAGILLRRATDVTTSELVTSLAVDITHRVRSSGDYTAALALAEKAAHTSEQLLGAQHPVALSAQYSVGESLFLLGRYQEAERQHRAVLQHRERILGPDHPDTLESCYGLQKPLFRLKQRSNALHLLRRAAEGRRNVLGETHPTTLQSRAALSEELATSGERQEFSRTAWQTVEDCIRFLGTDHPTTLSALHAHAFGVWRLGKTEEAEPLARHALAERERVQGSDHPQTLAVVMLLGHIVAAQGRWGEAIALARRAVAGREQALGQAHPWLIESRSLLISYLDQAGRAEEAKSMARTVLPLCNQILGADSEFTVRVRRVLEE